MERIEAYTIYGVHTPFVDCAVNAQGVILKLTLNPGATLDQLQEGIDSLTEKMYLANPPQQLDLFEVVDITEGEENKV